MPSRTLESALCRRARSREQASSSPSPDRVARCPRKLLEAQGPNGQSHTSKSSHIPETLPLPQSFYCLRGLETMGFCATSASTSPCREQIYPIHVTGSQNFVDLSFAISQAYPFCGAVMSQSHHHPRTAVTTKHLTQTPRFPRDMVAALLLRHNRSPCTPHSALLA